jgi:Fis family transcriptional regulator
MQDLLETMTTQTNCSLRDCIKSALAQYSQHIDGGDIVDLYRLVLGAIEPPLIQFAMEQTKWNQSKAAALLGISRSTFIKKLKQYQIEEPA